MKTYLASLLAVSCIASGVTPALIAAPSTSRVPLTAAEVNAFVEILRTNHPSLRAQDARVRASSHASRAVRAWGDPMLAFGGAVSDGARGPMLREEGDLIYELEQPLPLFGKASSARKVADRETEAELSRASLEFQSLRRDLAKILFTYAYQEESIEISREDLAWLQTMARLTEERYRAGVASQVETLRVQNEQSRRNEAFRTESLQHQQTRVSINRLLNRPFDSALPGFRLPEVAPPILLSSNLVALAVRNEPRLRLLRAETEVLEARATATRKSRLPDIAGFIEGRQFSGDGGFREATIGIKLNLPWLNGGKYRSDIARDRALADASRLDGENIALSVAEEIHGLVTEIDAARREALLFQNEIIPRSQLALESAHTAWVANRGMFNDVMESRRALLEARLMRAKAIEEQFQTMAELILCCGLGDLDALDAFVEKPASATTR